MQIQDGQGLKELFPGFFPPSERERKSAYQQGIVSLDANALLDLYRFTPHARQEYLDVLQAMSNRIFVTHQAALEFQRNRLSVINDRIKRAGLDERQQIGKNLTSVVDSIRTLANRYQINVTVRDNLCGAVKDLEQKLLDSIESAVKYDIDLTLATSARDEVLTTVENLLKGRVGPRWSKEEEARQQKEADNRKTNRIPPGYMDSKKGERRAAGDYFVWAQLLDEVARQKKPVLFVCNEQKEDWILNGPNGEILGPRPELVLEMKQTAGVQLHTATVAGLLREAPRFLGIEVSSTTVREAEAIPVNHTVTLSYSERAHSVLEALSKADRSMWESVINKIMETILFNRNNWSNLLPDVERIDSAKPLYLLRWSPSGRAVLSVKESFAFGSHPDIGISVRNISFKKG